MKQLDIQKTLTLLSKYKIPIVKSKAVKDANSAVKEAKSIGYPVVLKTAAEEIIHKSDAGGVKINITNENELVKAYSDIEKSAKKKVKKNAGLMLVQQQIQGTEIIIGMKRDPQFGPVIMFGLGGVFVEVLKDVSFKIAPLTKKDCIDMIHEIKGYPILEGARGMKKVNVDQVVNLLLTVSKLAEKNEQIIEMDFNPVIANDKQALIADVRLMVE